VVPHATPYSPTPTDCQCAFLQSVSSTETGDTIFYKFDTVIRSRQSARTTDSCHFSDGSRTTRTRVGNTDYYSGATSSLSGLTNRIGGTTLGISPAGTTSTHPLR
jgi:hypothetical protein